MRYRPSDLNIVFLGVSKNNVQFSEEKNWSLGNKILELRNFWMLPNFHFHFQRKISKRYFIINLNSILPIFFTVIFGSFLWDFKRFPRDSWKFHAWGDFKKELNLNLDEKWVARNRKIYPRKFNSGKILETLSNLKLNFPTNF
jgi:hypothetical protein